MLKNINDLVIEKKNKINSEEDKEKLENIVEILSYDHCFFEMEKDMAMDILSFLGIADSELLDYYMALISPQEYQKNMPKEYNLIEIDENASEITH